MKREAGTASRVFVLSPDELEAIVERAVRRVIGAQPSTDWVPADEVARWLDVKRDTLRTLIRRDGLPAHRAGKGYVFRRSEVEAWLEERSTAPGSHGRRHARTLRALPGGDPDE